MRTKDDTVIMDLTTEMMDGALIVEQVLNAHGIELVITSAKDSHEHKPKSKHNSGNAIDVRTWYIKYKHKMKRGLSYFLGNDFDVVVESDHIHIEYDPK